MINSLRTQVAWFVQKSILKIFITKKIPSREILIVLKHDRTSVLLLVSVEKMLMASKLWSSVKGAIIICHITIATDACLNRYFVVMCIFQSIPLQITPKEKLKKTSWGPSNSSKLKEGGSGGVGGGEMTRGADTSDVWHDQTRFLIHRFLSQWQISLPDFRIE